MQLAVIDLETTGVTASADRIVEIAIVRTHGLEAIETWSSLVRAEVSVGASERVHGISDAMLASAPTLAEVAGRIGELTTGATLVAHRAPFDVAFLDAAARRGELASVSAGAIDTAAIAERVFGETGLATLARRIGGRPPSHRALPDALAALDVLQACIETLGPIDEGELAALSSSRASMRSHVERALRDAMVRGQPLHLVYRPASGRAHEDQLRVESVAPPYATGTLVAKHARRMLRGDRIVRAWTGERPTLRFLDGEALTAACVDVGGSRS